MIDDPKRPAVHLMPGAEPYAHPGGEIGVLLCHGFTGTPQGLRPWAEHLAGQGYTVRLPRLPGHGTTWQDLSRTGWPQWYAEVDSALTELLTSCRRVVVAGLSMGGALALRLAQERPSDVAGVVLVNPSVRMDDPRLLALPLVRLVKSTVSGIANDIKKPGAVELAYDRVPLAALASLLRLHQAVTADLGKVDQPVLLFRSAVDHVVPASSSATVLQRIASTDVAEVVCADSYHVATLDNDAERIFAESSAFIARVAG